MEEPLARLVAFEPTTFPVLSVYLNTQPDQHGRTPDVAPYLHREFKALARTWAPNSPERHSFDRDVERIVLYTADKIDPAAKAKQTGATVTFIEEAALLESIGGVGAFLRWRT
ncbi:MAG: hypothetical protein ABSG56_36425 [Bryobacteraceae bacterium]|jgi:hypothetical protein